MYDFMAHYAVNDGLLLRTVALQIIQKAASITNVTDPADTGGCKSIHTP